MNIPSSGYFRLLFRIKRMDEKSPIADESRRKYRLDLPATAWPCSVLVNLVPVSAR